MPSLNWAHARGRPVRLAPPGCALIWPAVLCQLITGHPPAWARCCCRRRPAAAAAAVAAAVAAAAWRACRCSCSYSTTPFSDNTDRHASESIAGPADAPTLARGATCVAIGSACLPLLTSADQIPCSVSAATLPKRHGHSYTTHKEAMHACNWSWPRLQDAWSDCRAAAAAAAAAAARVARRPKWLNPPPIGGRIRSIGVRHMVS